MSELADLLRPTRDCCCSAYRRIGRAVTQHYEAALHESGLHIAQFTILSTVAQAGALPMSKLAAFLGLERTTLTRNLALLAKRGLVEIGGDEDGRVRRVTLTAAGERAVREAFPRWQAAQDTVDKVLRKHGA